jgi:8-oxo-dGTP diphosphatase
VKQEIKKNTPLELNPNVSVDCVIFGFDFDKLNVLVIDRADGTSVPCALPGNLIYNNEHLDQAAIRVLEELTGLKNIYLEQIGAFGDPNRISKASDQSWLQKVRAQPEARVITVAYFSLVKMEDYVPQASSFAKSAAWIPLNNIHELAFDHMEILAAAKRQLKQMINIRPIGFNLLPEKFTLGQLHKLYEAILDKPMDKRNFRRKIQKLNLVKSLEEKQLGVPHKPSQLFMFDENNYQKLMQTGFNNFGF